MKDPFKELADRAHFNIYHSSMWNNTGRRFAEMIAEECARMCMSQADRKNIRKAFGLPVADDVQYPGPEAHGSITSQYTRQYNLPKE
jgi:hypothetical protein